MQSRSDFGGYLGFFLLHIKDSQVWDLQECTFQAHGATELSVASYDQIAQSFNRALMFISKNFR